MEHAYKSFRHELKYFINQGQAEVLENRLAACMDTDSHADEQGRYHIRSLYFDDAENAAVREKLDGIDQRSKYRLRIYNFSDSYISLECKQKEGAFIHKSAVPISRALCDELCAGEYGGLLRVNAPVAREMYFQMACRFLRPAVIVDYVRTAFVAPYQNVRVTFDRELKSGVFSKDMFDPAVPTVGVLDSYDLILEVKFDEFLPDYYHRLVQTDYSMRSAASKYVICRKFE